MLKVADIMTSDVSSVSSSTPVIEVAHQMKVSGRWVIPVCDHDEFRGLITERDIVIKAVATGRDPVTELASSVMNSRQPVISPDDSIMHAAKVMVDSGVRVLAVVKDGKLLGLLGPEDLARANPELADMVFLTTMKPQVAKKKEHNEVAANEAHSD